MFIIIILEYLVLCSSMMLFGVTISPPSVHQGCLVSSRRILDITRKWTQENFDRELVMWTCVEALIAVGVLKSFVYEDELSEHTILYCRGISDIIKWKHDDLEMYDEDMVRDLYKNFSKEDLDMFKKHVINFYTWINSWEHTL